MSSEARRWAIRDIAADPVPAAGNELPVGQPDELYGDEVFNLASMKEYLPSAVFAKLLRTVLERALADAPQAPDEVLGALEVGARVRTVHGSHSGFAVVDRLSLWQAQISLGLARDTSHRHGLARRS